MAKALGKKRIIKYAIVFILILIVTVFIFCNSLVGIDKSCGASNTVSDIILPKQYSNIKTVLLIVRKAAHLFEYAILGVAVTILSKFVEKDFHRKMYSMSLLYAILVAVLDEHIQNFSGRTSSTSDILLDFFGAIIGMFSVILVTWFFRRLNKNNELN